MGNEQRAPSATELERMKAWVREGVRAGAVGLSTGLIYEPSRYARTDEVIALARELGGPAGGLYATHMRNEADGLLDAVREAIRVGEEAHVPVQISHHKASGRRNWGRVRDSLRLIEQARARGVDVTADQYPYTAGSTSLFAVLQNYDERSAGIGDVDWSAIVLASSPRHPEWEGQSVAALAVALGVDPVEAARQVLDGDGD